MFGEQTELFCSNLLRYSMILSINGKEYRKQIETVKEIKKKNKIILNKHDVLRLLIQ